MAAQMKIRTRLFLGFGSIVTLAAVILLFAYINISRLIKSFEWVGHTYEVIATSEDALQALLNMETGARGFLITGKDAYLAPYTAGQASFLASVEQGRKLTADNPAQVQRWDTLKRLQDEWQEKVARAEIAVRREIVQGEGAQATFRSVSSRLVGKQLFDELRGAIGVLESKFRQAGDTEGRLLVMAITQDMVNQETGQRGFLLTGKSESLEPYRKGQESLASHLDRLERMNVAAAGVTPAEISKVRQLAAAWVEQAAKPEIAAREEISKYPKTLSDITSMMDSGDGKRLMDGMRSVLEELTAAEEGLLKTRNVEAADLASLSKIVILAGLLLAVAIGVAVSLVIVRKLLGQLGEDPGYLYEVASRIAGGDMDMPFKDHQGEGSVFAVFKQMVANLKAKISEADRKSKEAGEEALKAQEASKAAQLATQDAEARTKLMLQTAEKLTSVANVVSVSSERLMAQIEQSSRASDEQASRMGETATAMEEMNATVLEVATNASSAAQAAEDSRGRAAGGAEIVAKLTHGMAEVQRQSETMKEGMSGLGKAAEGIGQIMNVISDIADQTNLLALNAAIEAARAGDAGRGFAVVADEVRKLAEKTMVATQEVGDAIRGIQNGTRTNIENVERSAKTIEEVTRFATESGNSLREIVALAERTTDQVRSIATASEEQASTSEEINRSIEDVTRTAMETSNAMKESAQAVGDLTQQAQILNSLIDTMNGRG